MSLLKKFFKPRWQSRDAAVRRAAVLGDDSAELIVALPRIAREDEDAQVRIAALKRVADVGLAHSISSDDADPSVRKIAESLWLELMSGRHALAPTVDVRLRLLGAQDESRLIEHVAEHGREVELRAAALTRIERPALLIERLFGEREATLRWSLLDRIDDEAQLNRIAERSRRSDKTLHRRVRDRIAAIRLSRGDNQIVSERARELCERLERQLRSGITDTDVSTQWHAIESQVPAALRTRYEATRKLIEQASDTDHVTALRERAAALSQFDNALTALERDSNQASASQHVVLGERMEELAELWMALDESAATQRQSATQRLSTISSRLKTLHREHDEQEDAAAARHAVKLARVDDEKTAEQRAAEAAARAARRAQSLAELEAAMQAMELALELGHSSDAETANVRLMQVHATVDGDLPTALHKRLTTIESEYADTLQWRNWGANQRRNQLCDEVEALPAAALHPDALATRVRELQTEWTQIEKVLGLTRPDRLGGRFRAACRLAIEPARPYFEKRDELRSGVAADLTSLIERGTALPEEIDDWKALAALRRELAAALRDLDRVDPRQRNALAAQIKDALGGIDSRITAHDTAVGEHKDALIAKATALSDTTDKRAAITASRELQKQWQASGNGARRRDDQQWKQFRAAVDAVFASADAEREQVANTERQRRDEASDLCADLEALSTADAAPERGSVQRIVDAFAALAVSDDALRTRMRHAQDALRLAAQARAHAAVRARYETWLEQWKLCRAVERCELEVDTARDQMAALPSGEICAEATAERFHAAISGIIAAAADESEFRDSLIMIEQFAGIESPDEDRQRRLELQVGQMSAHLRGDDRVEPAQRLEILVSEWLALGALPGRPDAIDQRFERGYCAAVERALSG